MKSPKPPFEDTKVIESRLVSGGRAIRRRREGLKSGYRFTTYERIERPNLVIKKKSGETQLFDRNKVMTGVSRACEKTSISPSDVEDIVGNVEDELYNRGDSEVDAKEIGDLVGTRQGLPVPLHEFRLVIKRIDLAERTTAKDH